jgi:RNA recognition motif-containing protein
MRIYVGNLPFSATDESLRSAFEAYGAVMSASVIIDRETGRSRGFGFVEMGDSDGRDAIEALNGQDLDGRALVVNEARERAPRVGGGYGGGGGRGGYGGGGGGYGGGGSGGRGGYGGGGGGGGDGGRRGRGDRADRGDRDW